MDSGSYSDTLWKMGLVVTKTLFSQIEKVVVDVRLKSLWRNFCLVCLINVCVCVCVCVYVCVCVCKILTF